MTEAELERELRRIEERLELLREMEELLKRTGDIGDALEDEENAGQDWRTRWKALPIHGDRPQ
jgi:hypothetical protein